MFEDLVTSVCEAAKDDDLESLKEACSVLIARLPEEPGTIDDELARIALKCLRSNRRFEQTRRMANAFLVDGSEDPLVVHFLAQGMIESGELLPAIRLLENEVARKDLHEGDWGELKGALGRAWKDLAMQTQDRRPEIARNAAQKSFHHYSEAWRGNRTRFTYQGVNMVAVGCWDERRGSRQHLLTTVEHEEARAGALSIVEDLTKRSCSELENWDYATLGEAHLGAGNYDEALNWYGAYTKREDSAFALAASARQLQQLWDADQHDWGESILALMIGKLGIEPGGGFSVSPKALERLASVPEDQHQAVLGDVGTRTYGWLQEGLRAATCVAIILKDGAPHGTGFAVVGKELDPELGEEIVVLTNAHVVTGAGYPDAAMPAEATVRFEMLHQDGHGPYSYNVDKVIWESHPDEHDVAVLRLDPAVPSEHISERLYHKLPELSGNKRRVYIIGHPSGREISFSFQDNELIAYENEVYELPNSIAPCRIQYRAPTEPGSSGSPVYDQNWRIIGIHHAGGRYVQKLDGSRNTHAANEGLWIESMRRALRQRPGRQGY